MARPRSAWLPRIVAIGIVIAIAGGTAVASADDLPASPRELYRSTTGSSRLASHGHDGEGITVAVIDTGVADVPGMHGSVIHQQNISAAPNGGDQAGHGTFVAGLVHEVAPGAKIVSIKLSGADGSVDVTQVLAALKWVSAHRDIYSIDVVNLSFGNDSKQSAYSSPLNFAVQQLWDDGIVVVASAGNLGDASGTVSKPGDDPLIISVGASDEHGTDTRDDDTVPAFVSRGPTQDGLAKPDLVAPGARIISLRAPGSSADIEFPQARVDSEHFRGSGTSFAAPIVSGIVAQMLSADPTLTPNQVKHGLLDGATTIQGDATAMGAGSVRAVNALAAARTGAANQGVQRSNGHGSLDGARGSAIVKVATKVRRLDGSIDIVPVRLTGERLSQVDGVANEGLLGGLLGGGLLGGLLATLEPSPENSYLNLATWDASSWGASSWGASSWGASSWGASSWGASSWGASSWGASSWGSSQWWASSWG